MIGLADLLLEKRGHVALITLNRPNELNALNYDLMRELDAALDVVMVDESIFVVVLTGAGRAFVAGGDISLMRDMTPTQAKAWSAFGNRILLKLEFLTKPTIAAVNGFALGGGCELAMACDIRLAAESAKFGQPEVTLGIIPGFGGTQRLPRLVGYGKAMKLALSGALIGAQEALAIGLADGVYPSEGLLTAAMELARQIASQAQVAVRQTKASVRNGMQMYITSGVAFEAEAFSLCFSTEDQRDAMTAFLDKRKLSHFKNV